MASLKWKTLTPEEREAYKEMAVTKKNIDVISLTKDQQEKIAKSFIKQIADQVPYSTVQCTCIYLNNYAVNCTKHESFFQMSL